MVYLIKGTGHLSSLCNPYFSQIPSEVSFGGFLVTCFIFSGNFRGIFLCFRRTLMNKFPSKNLPHASFWKNVLPRLLPCQACVVPGEFQVIFLDSNVEIVVLSSPAPVLVGESVDLPELLH